MSINDTLPFCDYCGLPYYKGKPTCECKPRKALITRLLCPESCPSLWKQHLDQEEQDDLAVLKHIT